MKRIISVLLVICLLLAELPLVVLADTAHVGDSIGGISGSSINELYKYSPSNHAYGVRLNLYEREGYKLLQTANWLNKHPEQPVKMLGTGEKRIAAKTITLDGSFSYEISADVPNVGSGGGKEWAIGEDTLKKMCDLFGKTVEDFQTGKYIIGIEPIQQMFLGVADTSYIGTATEIATFIQNRLKMEQQGYFLRWYAARGQLPDYATINNVIGDVEDKVRSNMGNLTNHDLPCSFFIDEHDPEEPDLGYSGNTAGFIREFGVIRTHGYGVFVLYTQCPYKGMLLHGSPGAKDEGCTCDPYCPYPGPWTGDTTLENDPNDPYNPETPVVNQDPTAIDKIDPKKPGHGSEDAVDDGCICPPKKEPEIVDSVVGPIKKDFLNRQYTSIPVDPCPNKYTHVSISGGTIMGHYDKSIRVAACSNFFWRFLGDRGFTASDTNLIASKSYNTFSSLPDPVDNINGIGFEYFKDHSKDSNGVGTVLFSSARGKHKRVRRCRKHGSHTTYYYDSETPLPVIYGAEETFFNTAKSATDGFPSTRTVKHTNGSATTTYIPLMPTQNFEFYPSYKMNYYGGSIGGSDDIWMLASGKRTFKNTPTLAITATPSTITCVAPWSRDFEDMQEDLDVVKAGNTIKVDGTPINYTLELKYFIHDDYFKDGVKRNYSTNKEYEKAMDKIGKDLQTLHLMSNVPYTGDYEFLIQNNLGIRNSLSSDILKKSLIPGLWRSTVSNVNIGEVMIHRSNYNGEDDVSSRASTVNGKTVSASTAITDIQPLITTGPSGHDWYAEDYEGIIRVYQKITFTVTPPSNQWLEIYRGVSDWLSDYNNIQNDYVIDGKKVYAGKDFMLGFAGHSPGYNVPQQPLVSNPFEGSPANYPAIQITNPVVPNSYYAFKIRGSAYDQS